MKKFQLFVFSLILGAVVFIAYDILKIKTTQNAIQQQVKQEKQRFSIERAPKESKEGSVASMSGKIKWESRIATAPAEISTLKTVKQGERLVTEDDGNVIVTFLDIGKVTIGSKTDLSFIQTLPNDFVFSQDAGLVDYENNSSISMSVRSFHLLVTITNGQMSLSVDKDKTKVNITVNKGSATIAYNDLQYISRVANIEKGQTYVFDDGSRTIVSN